MLLFCGICAFNRGKAIMNDFQLKCFLRAAQYENFTKAGESLFVAQPVVGRHVSNLEKELGCKLFTRERQSVKLTENGRIFADFVSAFFDRYDAVIKQLHENTEHEEMKLKLGSVESVRISSIFSEALKEAVNNNPRFSLSLSYYSHLDLVMDALYREELDMAFVEKNHAASLPNVYDYKEVLHVDTYLIIPNSHPLASKPSLTIDDFKNETFILRGKDGVPITYVLQMENVRRLGIKKCIETENISTFIEYLISGLGITTILSNHSLFYNPNFRKVYLPELARPYCEVLAWKKENGNPAIPYFCKIIDKYPPEDTDHISESRQTGAE